MWISLAREGAYVLAFEGLREGMGNAGMYLLLEWKKRFGSLRIPFCWDGTAWHNLVFYHGLRFVCPNIQ